MSEGSAAREAVFDELAVVGKAFGSPRRLELIELLAQGERTVDGLSRVVGMAVSSTSAHLQVLKLANLVRTRREGTKIWYSLAGDDVTGLFELMGTVARTRSADVRAALAAYLDLPGEEVGLVSRGDLEQLLAHDDVLLLDVRPAEEYAAAHIPGARHLPVEQVRAAAASFRAAGEDGRIVAYCRGSHCVMAHDAVRLLGGEGVPARRLEDGMLEWRAHGLPVQSGVA